MITTPFGPCVLAAVGCALSGAALAAKEAPLATLHETLRQHPDPLRRESAAIVIGSSGDVSALPLLLDRLQADGNRWVRAACAEALGLLGDRSAAAALRGALAREKHQRVRRALALALVRLGERAGLGELMWRMSSGNQHTKAETMHALVQATAQPLGQDAAAWWRYFGQPLQQEIGRPAGGVLGLQGRTDAAGSRTGPRLYSPGAARSWQQTCARRVRLAPDGGRITAATLHAYQATHGSLSGSCLLLLDVTPKQSSPSTAPAQPPTSSPAPEPPGLTLGAAQLLIGLKPRPMGVALAAPTTLAAQSIPAAKRALTQQGMLLIEDLTPPDRRLVERFRLLIVRQQPLAAGGDSALVLALLP